MADKEKNAQHHNYNVEGKVCHKKGCGQNLGWQDPNLKHSAFDLSGSSLVLKHANQHTGHRFIK